MAELADYYVVAGRVGNGNGNGKGTTPKYSSYPAISHMYAIQYNAIKCSAFKTLL